MADVGLNIKISADVRDAAVALGGLNDNFVELVTESKGSIASVNLALADLRDAAKETGNSQDLGLLNRAIKDLSVEAKNLKNIGVSGFDELGQKISQVTPAAKGLNEIFKDFKEGPRNIATANVALAELKRALDQATDPKKIVELNKHIENLQKQMILLRRAGTEGFDELGNKIIKTTEAAGSEGKGLVGSVNGIYGAVRKLAFILPGIGVAGIFGLIGTGAVEAVQSLGFFEDKLISTKDITKRVEEEAKKLHETLVNLKSISDINDTATGSTQGDISRVQALAHAIQDTTRSYKERQNALTELRETNKAYFGDLTLEAASLATLSAKVQEYSNALIQEAIVKANVEEIAKLSSEYLKQVRILGTLKEARDKALIEQDKPQASIGAGGTGTVGGLNISESARLASAVSRTTQAFNKQLEAVVLLRGSIDDYKGDLDNAIGQQIKLDPLKELKSPRAKDDLKSIIPILEQIKKIYDDLSKPNKEPIFKQLLSSENVHEIELLEAKISEAIKKGVEAGGSSSRLGRAFEGLSKALQLELEKLKTPDLHAHIKGIVDVTAEPISQIESKIEKLYGKQIHLKITPDIEAQINASGFSTRNRNELKKLIEDQLRNNIPVINLKAEAKILLRAEQVKEASQRLIDQVEAAINSAERSGLEGIGESIGKAIATGKNPIQAAGDVILQTIGQLIEQIGKALVEYGLVKSGLDFVIESGFALPGVAAIAIGVGAIAIGELIKSSFKPRAMADGGILTGPQYVLAGEAGPEAFMPLDKVGDFLKNTQPASQSVNVDGSMRISGQDLLIVFKRAQKNQSLVS